MEIDATGLDAPPLKPPSAITIYYLQNMNREVTSDEDKANLESEVRANYKKLPKETIMVIILCTWPIIFLKSRKLC